MKLDDMSRVAREGFGRTKRPPCMSAKEIAEKLGVTYQAVRGYAQRLGITSKLAHRHRTYGNSTVRNTWYSLPDAKRIMAAIEGNE